MSSSDEKKSSSLQNVVHYIVVFSIITAIIIILVEYRKFANSAVGKALGSVLGFAATALLWLANHPVFAILGIVGLLLLFPLLSGMPSKMKEFLVDKVGELSNPDTNKALDRSLRDADLTDAQKESIKEIATRVDIKKKIETKMKDTNFSAEEKVEMAKRAKEIGDIIAESVEQFQEDNPDVREKDFHDAMTEAGKSFPP